MNINNFGTLYIVATPIGNLRDITLRAIEILKTVKKIAAEDTRHSLSLLQHLAINTPMMALHEHNELEKSDELLSELQNGQSIALISDAGTPLINDPGYILVRKAREQGIKVVPIPGACALIAALCASGLPTDRFVYEGFLPAKTKARIQHLETVAFETRTLIFYETPHRILDCLKDMEKTLGGERRVVIARELTKLHETITDGTLTELVAWVSDDKNQQRGEIVLMVAGSSKTIKQSDSPETDKILKVLLTELPLKQAVDLATKILDKRKNELYDRALEIKETLSS